MKKSEAEKNIRSLCHVWASERTSEELKYPNFGNFKRWMIQKGYGECFDFRSEMGPDYAAEMWFDQEMKQSWRN